MTLKMTLKDLMKVLPAYCTVHVHGTNGDFALTGTPHTFANGIYSMFADRQVKIACPLSSYTMEVTIQEELK